MNTSRNAIVIGAGLAGLAAARDLADRGVEVILVEGRDRVGGRVWSARLSSGELAELGAEWIMPGDRAILDLASLHGLEVIPTGTDYRERDARGPGAASIEDQRAFLDIANESRARIPDDQAASLSLGRFLDSLDGTEAQRRTLKVRLQGTFATDLDHVALRVTDGERAFSAESGPYVRLELGNQELANRLAASLPDVRLGRHVDHVAHDHDGVSVRTGDDTLRAQAAVLAVPVRIAARLGYEPALPDDLAIAMRELPMGVASKLAVATVGEPSPRSIQSTDLPFWCWVANSAGGRPRRVLTSFAGSEEAQQTLGTASGDPGRWLERLRRLNPDVALVGEPLMHAWASDPFALGAYSAWDNRSWDRRDQFERRVGRLCFAGEHTAGPHGFGTMNGAVLSGRRAARQALEVLD